MTNDTPRGDEGLPVFDAVEVTADLPDAARRSALRPGTAHRALGPARGAGLVAGALVLLVVGIVVGSVPPVDTSSSSPSGSDGAVVPSGSPAEGSTAPCALPQAGRLPVLTIGIEGGNAEVGGVIGFGSGNGVQTQLPGWQVEAASSALAVTPTQTLVLKSSLGVCLRHAIVEYAATSTGPDAGLAQMFRGEVSPPSRAVPLTRIPIGDWVIRVTAYFVVLPGGSPDDNLVTVSYFRVVSGPNFFATPAPTTTVLPTPMVTPATPCGTGQPSADIEVLLLSGSADPVPGADPSGPGPAIAHVALGDPIEVVIDNDVCAVAWELQLPNESSGDSGVFESVRNPALNPDFAAQNRWPVATNGVGDEQALVARLQFVGGIEIIRAWRIVVDPFLLPDAFLVGPDGTRFQASAGCGIYLQLANGYEAGDGCGSIGYTPTLEALVVPAWTPVTFEIPGWSLTGWGGNCGQVTVSDTEYYDVPTGCSLGGASKSDGGPLTSPALFLVPPGDYVVQIYASAIGPSGDRFSVPFYAHVVSE